MSIRKVAATATKLLITVILITTPLSAQRRRPAAPKPQPPAQPAQVALTFETFLAADSYKIYGEVRGVGQVFRSAGLNEVLDPLIRFMSPPKEFKSLVNWLNSHADALTTSRLMFAAWPSRPKLPNALVVIEFATTEEAQKFEPQLRGFLPKLLPTPTPEPASNPANAEGAKSDPKPKAAQPTAPPAPPFILKQSGPLVFISDTTFTFKALRPTSSKLMAEDHNFRQVHDRFNTESLFVYVDALALEKEERERMRQMEEEQEKRKAAEAANPAKVVDEKSEEKEEEVSPEELQNPQAPPHSGEVTLGTLQGQPQPNEPQVIAETFLSPIELLSGAFFRSRPTWPDAIGIAVNLDPDSYVLRVLLLNGPDVKGNPIPIVPQLVTGPPLTFEAPSILPADTEMLVTASLDYPQIYEGFIKAANPENEAMRGIGRVPVRDERSAGPFVVYETQLGIKIKDDLLPLLGNEIAVSLPMKTLGVVPAKSSATPAQKSDNEPEREENKKPDEPNVVVAVSVRDREGVRTLLPKLIESVGFKGAGMLAQTEKRDDTELVSYANAFAYAFIGNFLVISPDAQAVRHVVDSYLKNETLASDSNFRNFTRWQPRQLLGQVYFSPALMDGYNLVAKDANVLANDKLRDLIARLSPTPEAVTYAISNDGLGPLHELHVPRNLVLLMIAAAATESSQPPLVRNEAMAQAALRVLSSAEATYQATMGNGKYGTLEQLIQQGLVAKDLLEKHGYKIELTVSGDKFEASAVPVEYGKTGRMSFFVDETAQLRGGDHGGGPATVSDKPVQ